MLSRHSEKTIVGLDIEAGSIAAAEVSSNGRTEVVASAVAALPPGAIRDGEVADPEALGAALKEMFASRKLSRDVRLGVANQRVAVRTIRLPALESAAELEAAIRFRAQDEIPMPLEQAVLDWQVVARRTGEDGSRSIDVVAVAARRDMIGRLLEALRGASLRPVGIDLSAFGMIRALGDELLADVDGSATALCNLGDAANLAIVEGRVCAFTRSTSFGVEAVAQRLAERRRLTLEHARQWLLHVGLDASLEEVDGDPETVQAAREVLEEGVAKLVDEVRLSLEFHSAREGAAPVGSIVACGHGTTIPGLVERLAAGLGYPLAIGRPAALAALGDEQAARLTLPFGLALEG